MDKIMKKNKFLTFIITLIIMLNVKAYATNNITNEETGDSTTNEIVNEASEPESMVNNEKNNVTTSTGTNVKTKLNTIIVDSKELTDGDTITVDSDTVTVRTNVDMYYISVNGVSVSGSQVKLRDGKNTVVAKGENGETVTIYINKEALKEEIVTNTVDNTIENTVENKIEGSISERKIDEKEFGLSSLKVEGWNISPTFKSDVYTYTLYIDKDDCNSINVTAKANSEDSTVSISGTDDLKEGENVVNVLVTSNDESEIKTYQIIVNKTSGTFFDKYKINLQTIAIAAIATIVIIFVIIVILKRRHSKDDEEQGNDKVKYQSYKVENKPSKRGKKSKGKH